MKRIISGNEAAARGAWEAGAEIGSGYPGTPSTEIMETFALYPGVYAEWAPNEKVALDAAIGAAYAGKRSFSTMKHVGLNVAADAFFYAAMTGIEAGLVIVSADDPSMHSSQNEQDNRQFAKFARIPCLDPADSQDSRDFMMAAFDLSEQFDTPVMLRMTTRVCHTSGPVEVGETRAVTPDAKKYPRNQGKYVMVPANARKRHGIIEHRIQELAEYAETCPFNRVEMRSRESGDHHRRDRLPVRSRGFPGGIHLKLGMVYPLPQQLIREFAASVDKLIVLEELDPFIEDQVRLMGIDAVPPGWAVLSQHQSDLSRSRVSSTRGRCGRAPKKPACCPPARTPRSGKLILTCPCARRCCARAARTAARSSCCTSWALPVNGDIGCYTLGVTPPLNAIDTCGCMGASIGVAHGAAIAGDNERHVAVIGDSTFFHTGIPALINVAYNHSNVITIIMDNRITGMTGHQENPGTGKTLQDKDTVVVEIEPLGARTGHRPTSKL